MDEIFGGFFRGLAHGIGYFVGEVLCKYLFQYSGALVLKILSIGKYPQVLDEDPFDSFSSILMTILGAIIWIGGLVFLLSNYA
ncbi:hypothetical protein [Agarivorans sp. QJM3NY_25]|uniref:hypothetical protein n=1 Tax=Agarivorans sp. QJM3NY_25 TaxID=3421430 RepID=UPI003D7EB09D